MAVAWLSDALYDVSPGLVARMGLASSDPRSLDEEALLEIAATVQEELMENPIPAGNRVAEPEEYAVHPVAALFPMLSAAELAELAGDIEVQGLLHPIVKDAEGCILDGRNRLAACKLAGVKPRFSTYKGSDPAGYALSSNVFRRHMALGARAMVIVIARDLTSLTDAEISALKEEAGTGEHSLRHAIYVRTHGTPEMVAGVLAGGSLKEAYEKAQKIAGVEVELRRLKNSVTLQLEQVGVPVVVRPAPNLSPNGMVSKPVVLAGANEDAELLRQQRELLGNLSKANQLLREAFDTLPPLGGPMAGLMAPGVLARISHIVDNAYAIAQKCNEAHRTLSIVEEDA